MPHRVETPYILLSGRHCAHTDQLLPLALLVGLTIPHHTESLLSLPFLSFLSLLMPRHRECPEALPRATHSTGAGIWGGQTRRPERAQIFLINEEGSQETKHTLLSVGLWTQTHVSGE